MRVNVYAEEMTDKIEIISKEVDGQTFTGVRFYLELPVTLRNPAQMSSAALDSGAEYEYVRGPFIHRPGDNDSAAVTFWGKRNLRHVLQKAINELNKHYRERERGETNV